MKSKELVIAWHQHELVIAWHQHDHVCLAQGWLDDRVECRNALSKLYKLESLRYMDRTEIPFVVAGEREPRYWEWGKK